MLCPKCSSTIADTESVFCPRCSTKLSPPITSPTVGWEPVPNDQVTTDPTSRVQSISSGDTKLRALKVGVCGILAAVMLTWCGWVTNYLQRLPDKAESTYRAMQNPHNIEQIDGFANELGRDSLTASLPVGIILGLVIGIGVGVILTLPETAKNPRKTKTSAK